MSYSSLPKILGRCLPVLVLFGACTPKKERISNLAAVRSLHQDQRRAHMEKNVSLLVHDSLSDYIEINRGTVKNPGPAASRNRFQAYFNAVDFIKWDDITPPVFSFSDDSSMASSVVEKLVITRDKASGLLDTTRYAWLAVYKKTEEQWRLHRMGSTNQ